MATVRELSDKLGVSKTAILSYCKDELGIKPQPRKALQLSANQCAVIADHFSEHEQRANREDIKESAKVTENQTDKPLQLYTDEVFSLQLENAVLKERISALESENKLLRERLEVADKHLEREQMQVRGFWSRLGQKLLGTSKDNNNG
jgi:septal ring factor EnvC (AmiA/AmiB activator)